MLWNPGELPDRWTVAKLETKHASIPFNSDVANTFFRAGKIEAWGIGIERIMGACREAGTPRPRISHEASELWLEFPFLSGYGVAATTQETTQERILALLRREPALTGKQLAERTGLSASGVKYHLGKLRQAGRIRHVGASKKGHWEVGHGNR